MNPISGHYTAATRDAGKGMTSLYAECQLWRNRLRQRPDDPNTLCGLANALLNSGQREEAEFTVRSALALAPDMPDGHYILGRLLHQRGSHVAAVAQYRHALTFGANTGDIWNDLGCSLTAMGDPSGAREAFQTAVRLAPRHAGAHNNLGENLRSAGKLQDAMRWFASAARLDPTLADACINLGAGLVEMGRSGTALPLLTKGLALNPGSATGHLQLGVALAQQNRHAQAIESLELAARLAPSERAFSALARSLVATGHMVAAVESLRRALELSPDEPRVRDEFAMTLLAAGMPAQALDVTAERLRSAPASATALAARTVALARQHDSGVHALLDFDRLSQGEMISTPPGYETLQAFNTTLAGFVSTHPALTMAGKGFGVHKGHQTGPLLVNAGQPLAELARRIEAATRGYVQRAGVEGGHPLFSPPPTRWRLAVWGIVLGSQGYQAHHFRPAAWLSGIYSVRVPSIVGHGQDSNGCLHLGFAPRTIDPEQLTPGRIIRPREGQLLLFPSYFFRHTAPFTSTETSVSIAFDIIRHD